MWCDWITGEHWAFLMLFLPCLKLNVHLHLSKFKAFLSSQHVVRDTLMKMMEVDFAQPYFPRLYVMETTNGKDLALYSSGRCWLDISHYKRSLTVDYTFYINLNTDIFFGICWLCVRQTIQVLAKDRLWFTAKQVFIPIVRTNVNHRRLSVAERGLTWSWLTGEGDA